MKVLLLWPKTLSHLQCEITTLVKQKTPTIWFYHFYPKVSPQSHHATEVDVFRTPERWFLGLPLPNTYGIPWMHSEKPNAELVIMEVWRNDFLNFILKGRIFEVVSKQKQQPFRPNFCWVFVSKALAEIFQQINDRSANFNVRRRAGNTMRSNFSKLKYRPKFKLSSPSGRLKPSSVW